MIDQEFDELSRKHSELGRTLVLLRKREKMTQTELAARVGIRRQVLQRIEKWPECSSIRTLRKITDELGEPLSKVLKHVEKAPRNT